MDEWQMARFHYFSWLNNIPVCVCVCEVCTAWMDLQVYYAK